MGEGAHTATMRLTLLTLLLVSTVLVAARDHSGREHGREHEISWFRSSSEKDCEDVDESNPPSTIQQGKPSNDCKDEETEFCFCYKRGTKVPAHWQRSCGQCKKNDEYSIKVDHKASDTAKRPYSPCADGSQPTCGGKEPVCGDGSPFQETGFPCTRKQGKPKCEDSSIPMLCEDGTQPRGHGRKHA